MNKDELAQGGWERVVRGIPTGIVVATLEDPDDLKSFRFVFANDAFSRLTGVPAAEVMGTRVLASFPDLAQTELLGRARDAVLGRTSFDYGDFPYGDSRVTPSVFVLHVFALSDDTACFCVDNVTDQRRAEAALRQSQHRTRLILENAQDAFISCDARGTILDWNPQAELTFGRPRDEALGMSAEQIVDATTPLPSLLAANLSAGGHPLELIGIHRSGRRFPLELSVSIMPDGDAQTFAIFLRDISERKRAEAERILLLEAEQAARRQTEAALAAIETLQRINEIALDCSDVGRLIERALIEIRAALHAGAAALLTTSGDGLTLHTQVLQDLANGVTLAERLRTAEAGTARILAAGRALAIDDPDSDASLAGVPLIVRDKLLGLILVASAAPGRFGPAALRLLQSIGDRMSLAMERTQIREELDREREQLEALSRRFVDLQEAERKHVARELHDELGQGLTGLRMMIDASGGGRSSQHTTVQQQLLHCVDDLIVRVRDLSMELRPPMLDELGLLRALAWQLEHFTAQTQIRVHLSHAGIDRRFSPSLEIAAIRIIQEALTNVARHARVREASVSITLEGSRMRLVIADQGVGFDPEPALRGASSGLSGMRERLRLLGGELQIQARPRGGGTRVVGLLPIED